MTMEYPLPLYRQIRFVWTDRQFRTHKITSIIIRLYYNFYSFISARDLVFFLLSHIVNARTRRVRGSWCVCNKYNAFVLHTSDNNNSNNTISNMCNNNFFCFVSIFAFRLSLSLFSRLVFGFVFYSFLLFLCCGYAVFADDFLFYSVAGCQLLVAAVVVCLLLYIFKF